MAATLTRSSRLHGLDLTGAEPAGLDLAAVAVRDGSWANVDASEASIARLEATGCELTDLAGAERLHGTRMPWPDVIQIAGLLATAAGIQIVD